MNNMIILGANSDIAKAFLDICLRSGEKYDNVYLLSSRIDVAKGFTSSIESKYKQVCTVIEWDACKPFDLEVFNDMQCDLLFCAAGYLGDSASVAMSDFAETKKVIDINYAGIIPLLNYWGNKMRLRQKGTIIGISSVAGERGRQSNFIYGSAKAGLTSYLSGLRNYLANKGVHVMTVKPGFVKTKMTAGMLLRPSLTASPQQAAYSIYKGYRKRRNTIYVISVWRIIMWVIRNIPEFIFKRMRL